MRLEKIKLAGFKSFVDPTTVLFPSDLVGVVGPNGCGKSNVIDAVRWVMGEISAKMLRGESMADVIFNGSSSRKPVGTASIELLFDNSDGAVGGQYAQYGQISVKRLVTRDGQSSYFLNGVRCRRRDITDLFLGTGLGPRSYAIIEQGMISRIIESRPEELRVYLEEAAGISKYKERRKETEKRIRHTRENLDRLNDLREEIQKQLRHLERQAATAERYKSLKQEERKVGGELLALRLLEMEQDLQTRDRQIAELETRLQAGIATQRKIESEIEQQREAHHDANECFNEIQGNFYAVGSDIARLEEGIQYARETRQRNESELQRAQQSLEEARRHSSTDQEKLETLAEMLLNDQPELEAAKQITEETLDRRQVAEASMQSWQSEWDQFNARAAQPAQTAQVNRSLINQLERQEGQHRRRLEKLEEERSRLSDIQLQTEIKGLEKREQEEHANSDEVRSALEVSLSSINRLREENAQRQQSLADARTELETLKGRQAALQALQQAALGDDDQHLHRWLDEAGLSRARHLLEHVQVESGWQTAVENVLGHHLQAICVPDLAGLEAAVTEFSTGSLNLIEMSRANLSDMEGTLAAVVQGPDQLRRMLSTVYTASDLNQALAKRQSISVGESIVTPAGEWLGSGWLCLQKGQDVQIGILAREQEIRELSQREDGLLPVTRELAQTLAEGQQVLQQSEQQREQHQASLESANMRLADCQAQLSGKRARAEHIRQRVEALVLEGEETRLHMEQDNRNSQAARDKLHRALEQMESLGVRREQLVTRRERLQSELRDTRDAAQQASLRAHEIALRVESTRSSQQSLLSSIERMHGQLLQLSNRCDELRENLEIGQEPLLLQQQDLEAKLKQRMAVEAELGEARNQLQAIDYRLRELETERHQSDRSVVDARERLNQGKLSRQEVLVRSTTVDEQLRQTGLARVELLAQLSQDATIALWQEKLAQLSSRIQRLGSINLAAIDEFREQGERAKYLENQHDDVLSALETLEEAIRKIDRETRTRFKETFDKVNTGLKEMFPKLFGGGHAYLELVGEDPLDAGVAIMARPPGKRNASIHLLSGGEKALSAVAMVFAIFQLNPAPFCMLDEVDAPLDDANVSRFCALVKEMSANVQFIFITHNKLTMEIAHQLTGVTMSEPGVSRLVSVDIEEAAQLAAM